MKKNLLLCVFLITLKIYGSEEVEINQNVTNSHYLLNESVILNDNLYDIYFCKKVLLEKQLRKTFYYQNSLQDILILDLETQSLRYQWMPVMSMLCKPKYFYQNIQGLDDQNELYSSIGVNIKQKLPLGLELESNIVTCSTSVTQQEIKNNFNFVGKVNISIPLFSYLYGLTSDIIYYDKQNTIIHENRILLFNQMIIKENAYQVLSNMLTYFYLTENIFFYQQKISLYKKYLIALEAKYEQGQITFFEYEEAKSSLKELLIECTELILTKNSIEESLYVNNIKIEDYNYSFNEFVQIVNRFIEDDSKKIKEQKEFNDLQLNWKNKIDAIVNSLPTLSLCVDISPCEMLKDKNNLFSEFVSYWGSSNKWNFCCSLSLCIPLFDYDEIFLNKKKLQCERQKYNIEMKQLNNRVQIARDMFAKKTNLLNTIYNQDLAMFESERSKNIKKELLFQENRISYYDYEFSKINLLELELICKKDIVTILINKLNNY